MKNPVVRLVYTVHARQRMEIRGITDDMVRLALEMPDKEDTGYLARSLSYRRFPNGQIKVVYKEEQEHIIVITVMWED